MDEHPDSISKPDFYISCAYQGERASFFSHPGFYHNGAGSMAFADGHTELRRWVDGRTKPPMTYTGYLSMSVFTDSSSPLFGQGYASPNNPDISWLQARTSARS